MTTAPDKSPIVAILSTQPYPLSAEAIAGRLSRKWDCGLIEAINMIGVALSTGEIVSAGRSNITGQNLYTVPGAEYFAKGKAK